MRQQRHRCTALGAGVFALLYTTAAAGSVVVSVHRVPSPNNGAGPNLLAAAAVLRSGEAWTVGSRASAPNAATDVLVEHLGPSGWNLSAAPSPGGSSVLAAVSGSCSRDVWAAGWHFPAGNGLTLTEHWNGTAWSIVPSPNRSGSGFLAAVTARTPTDAWAVGFWDGNNGFPEVLVEHWNGTAWTIQHAPQTPSLINQLTGVVALASNDVWAVGFGSDPESGIPEALIDHFDGTSWHLVTTPGRLNRQLNGVAATSADDVWAVGSQLHGTVTSGLVEHWNGTFWSVVPSPAAPSGSNTLTAVTARSTTEAWAVGWSDATPSSARAVVTELWTGSAWVALPAIGAGSGDSTLLGVGEGVGGQVWAVGSGNDATGTPRTLIMANCPLCA
jgi:hypothetical protein